MQSFTSGNRDPLTTSLFDALSAHVDVRHFSWRRALLGRYDILHVHWPDHLTERRGAVNTAFRRLMYLLLLIRIRLGRPVLVRTLHNVEPHEARRGLEQALLRLTDRWTSAYVTMLADTPLPSAAPSALIPQGHYRTLYDDLDVPESEPGVLLFFGNLRAYKGVPALLDAFQATTDDRLRLRVVGRAVDREIGESVERACRHDDRISAELGWVSHEQLATEIGRAELVVLPYLAMHNSGTVIVALSLDRPVLVPTDHSTLALSAEVGAGWVHSYEPPLTSAAITTALSALRKAPPCGRPDLSARDWQEIASAYVETYQEARLGRRREQHD
jgi:beta-1,4-mannosyltransferase